MSSVNYSWQQRFAFFCKESYLENEKRGKLIAFVNGFVWKVCHVDDNKKTRWLVVKKLAIRYLSEMHLELGVSLMTSAKYASVLITEMIGSCLL